jgi:hypothetical protein
MFLTEPPCKALGIYVPHNNAAGLEHVTRLCDTQGLRVGHFLSALEQHAEDALIIWQDEAKIFRQGIQDPHWTDFTTLRQKENVWTHPGYPKFMVFLERADDQTDSPAKIVCPYGENRAPLTVRNGTEDIRDLDMWSMV